MKKPVLIFLLATSAAVGLAQEQNLLSGKYTSENLQQVLISQASWKPFPAIDDRAGWSKADAEMMKGFVEKAETFIDYEWPYIPATKSLLIARTGDREEYQTVSFKKREVLGTLLLGEIAENKGRFIDPIINGVVFSRLYAGDDEGRVWQLPYHMKDEREALKLLKSDRPTK